MRKLATVRKIEEIKPIPNADKICAYRVDGWWVVDRIGTYNVGDLVVYFEIDSFIPHNVAPFLSKGKEPREFEGVKGERLRTIKLKGQLSQGLLLPVEQNYVYDVDDSDFAELTNTVLNGLGTFIRVNEGDDVTEYLGILKWEAPIPAQLAGTVKGSFPSFIPKTDQERIQNLTIELEDWKACKFTCEITEKLDGTSMTVFCKNNEFGVCGRNWELTETDSNSLWKVARTLNLEEKLHNVNSNIALQGELIGEGIQGNPYNLKGQQFFVYDVYNIDRGIYFDAITRTALVTSLGISHVPIESTNFVFSNDVTSGYLLKLAEGKSALNKQTEREGLVFKCIEDPSISFKAISNTFLLHYDRG